MNNNISTTITRLTDIITDPNCTRMNLSTVKGYLGELLIKKKLEDEGLEVVHHGNQSGYDLSIVNTDIKIDVKTSLPKDEFKWHKDYWGWALLHENKKKDIKASHIVCLGLKKNYSPYFFIVIPIERVGIFPRGIKQFSKVKHSLVVTPDTTSDSEEDDFVKQCKSHLTANAIKIKMFNDKIKNDLNLPL